MPTPPNEAEKPKRKIKAKPPSVEDLQRSNQTLTALLSHFAPDVDPGAEKDRIAFYEDGTPVYVPPRADGADEDDDGLEEDDDEEDELEDTEEETGDEEEASPARRIKPKPVAAGPRLRKPAEQRRNTARQKPDVTAMISEARKVNAGL